MNIIKPTIAALAVAGVLLTAGCAPRVEAGPAPQTEEPAAPVETQAPEPEPVETAEPEPVEVEGSLDSPFPSGYEANVYQGSMENTLYTIVASLADGDAWPAISKANQFNEAPAEGMKYIIVKYLVSGVDNEEPTNVSMALYDYSAADANGVTYRDASVVLPDDMPDAYESNDLYAGQSFTAFVAYEVPADIGTTYVTAYGSYFSL